MNKGYIIVVPWSSWLGPDVKEMGMGTRKINSFSLHLQRPKSSVLNNVTQSNKISNQELDSATPTKKTSALSSAEIITFFGWMNLHFFLAHHYTHHYELYINNEQCLKNHSAVSWLYCWWSLQFFALCWVCSLAGSLYVVTRYMKYDASGNTAGSPRD